MYHMYLAFNSLLVSVYMYTHIHVLYKHRTFHL